MEQLNTANCKRVGDLYDMINGRVMRNKGLFNALGYTANINSKTSQSNKNNNEFKGLYVFGEEKNNGVEPVYIGISRRTVYRRLRQHGWGTKHNECSLAYLMARFDDKELMRATVDNDLHLVPKKAIIQSYKVALFSVENDYDLYFLEVALAGKFKTFWNSFRTH